MSQKWVSYRDTAVSKKIIKLNKDKKGIIFFASKKYCSNVEKMFLMWTKYYKVKNTDVFNDLNLKRFKFFLNFVGKNLRK